MPLNTNTSIIYQITDISITIDPASIKVGLIKGYYEDGLLNVLNRLVVDIPADQSVLIFAKTGDSNKTLYETLKEILYGYMLENGLAEGTIE